MIFQLELWSSPIIQSDLDNSTCRVFSRVFDPPRGVRSCFSGVRPGNSKMAFVAVFLYPIKTGEYDKLLGVNNTLTSMNRN